MEDSLDRKASTASANADIVSNRKRKPIDDKAVTGAVRFKSLTHSLSFVLSRAHNLSAVSNS